MSKTRKTLGTTLVVIQASYEGGEYKFYFSREGSVYFNIKEKGNVIQASLIGGRV
jgi:hypothetical protein